MPLTQPDIDQGFTTTLGNRYIHKPWWKSIRPSPYLPVELLLNRAKKLSGRSSLAYEMAFGRKRTRSMAFNPGRGTPQIPLMVRPAKRRRIGGGTRTKTPAPGGPITAQYDYKVSRGIKRLTKGQRKWKKFVKKVQKASNDNDKSHFLVEANNANSIALGIVGIEFQAPFVTLPNSVDSDLRLSPVGDIGQGPLKFINNLIQQKSVTTIAAGTVATAASLDEVKYKLNGAVCTLSIKNLVALSFFDIYECVANNNITDINHATAYQSWEQCGANAEPDQTGGYQKLDFQHSGCTPYMAPQFGQWWKIIKKTRVLMGVGQKINYSYFTRKRQIQNEKVIGQYATKGLTKDLIIVHNPTYNGDNTTAQQYNIEWSKCYSVKLPGVPGLQTQWAYKAIA